MTICPKTFWASFFHHTESMYKTGRNTDQDKLRYPVCATFTINTV